MVAAVVLPYLIDVDDHLIAAHAQPFGGGRDDPPIGLMRDQKFYVLRGITMTIEQIAAAFRTFFAPRT